MEYWKVLHKCLNLNVDGVAFHACMYKLVPKRKVNDHYAYACICHDSRNRVQYKILMLYVVRTY